MPSIPIIAPVDGWLVSLAEVPDPVFAGGMAGAGVAIDPTSDHLSAPCDGLVRLMRGGRHALTIATAAGDLLLHVGIDTVALRGEGFELQVQDGATVRAGDPLLRFDLDGVARRAPSLVTPVLMVGRSAADLSDLRPPGRVRRGDVLYRVQSTDVAQAMGPATAGNEQRGRFRVPFDHGLHARPAAGVVAALANLEAEVEIHANGRQASARSMIGLMTLGVGRGDVVEVVARGAAATAALGALAALLEPAPVTAPPAPSPAPAATGRAPDGPLRALVASRGIAIGRAHRWREPEPVVPAGSGDPSRERAALDEALRAAHAHLERRLDGTGGARRGVLEAHRLLLLDPELHATAARQVAAGASAGGAWRAALRTASDALGRLDDARMAERRADLRDLERLVLRVLNGQPPEVTVSLPECAIVLADELLPSQLLSLDPGRLAGLCTASGGATSHVAILAAALGKPMLVAAGEGVLGLQDGTELVVDAEAGVLHVAPPASLLERYAEDRTVRAAEAERDARHAFEPARLRDGTVVRVDSNLGSIEDARAAVAAGAEGCGLLRTEFLFLDRTTPPDEDEQHEVYSAIAAVLDGRPLTIRTLDAGGDKPIPFLPMPAEENPALGLRGVRTGFWQPSLLDTQLRAVLRTAAVAPCRLLLPMVTDVADVVRVRSALERITAETGLPRPPLGIMVETPASAWLADQLAPLVDFFSIGSNDLSQYVLAIDRLHPVLAQRLDALHPAVLRAIAAAARAATAHGKELCVCGGLASDPDAVPLLVGLGVRELSVVPSMLARIKSTVRRYERDQCERMATHALGLASAEDVRASVRECAGAAGATVEG